MSAEAPKKTHAHGFFEKIGIENHDVLFSDKEGLTADTVYEQVNKHFLGAFQNNPQVIDPIRKNAIQDKEKEINDALRTVYNLTETEIANLNIESKLKLAQSKQTQLLNQKDNELLTKFHQTESALLAQTDRIESLKIEYEAKLHNKNMEIYLTQISASQSLTNDLPNVMPALESYLNRNYQMTWNSKQQQVDFKTLIGGPVMNENMTYMTSQEVIIDALKKTKYLVVNETVKNPKQNPYGNTSNSFNNAPIANNQTSNVNQSNPFVSESLRRSEAHAQMLRDKMK